VELPFLFYLSSRFIFSSYFFPKGHVLSYSVGCLVKVASLRKQGKGNAVIPL
jgi:hypothetical protein